MRLPEARERALYVAEGWWGDRPLHAIVRDNAVRIPDGRAIVTADSTTSWAEYDAWADDIAALVVGLGLDLGDHVAVKMPDGPGIHAALVGTARAGVVGVGIGHRAGRKETAHLTESTGARVMIAAPSTAPLDGDWPAGISHVIVQGDKGVETILGRKGAVSVPVSVTAAAESEVAGRALGPDQLSMINSTSGTTGLPKCVTQFDNRWLAFSELARRAGGLTSEDVFLGAVPAPFGFGLWTSHYAPAVLGVPLVVLPRFDVEDMIRLIEREQVSVLCCVSTQFKMLLNAPSSRTADLTSLRVMFTGGEAVPYKSAAAFEERTGATVLQFYGSNETGALSYTTLGDPPERRLRTAGRVIDTMRVRLFDEDGNDVTGSGAAGVPAGRGPLTCGGYYGDEAANAELYTQDGWMLMGDVVQIDDAGYLTVIGRNSDIIIRGGKNISAARVENEIDAHPDIELCVVVPVPDPVFGEKACAVVTVRDGMSVDLADLTGFLRGRGVSSEMLPEYLLSVDALPRSSGGKLAKAQVKAWAAQQVGAQART